MRLSETQVKKIITSSSSLKFSQLGFSLLITRMASTYISSPSNEVLKECTDELNAFLTKFEVIMKKDIDMITNL